MIRRLITTALQQFSPTVHQRSAAAFTSINGADLLADSEADLEVWEPAQLQAARERHPAGKQRKGRP